MIGKIFQSTASFVLDKFNHDFKNVNDWSDEESVQGKIVVVTGANRGLGKVVTEQLAKRNAIVIMACRDLVGGAKAATEIQTGNPNANLDLLRLDLGDLASIQDFSIKVHSKYTHVNILINNAAVPWIQGLADDPMTQDGFEIHMGTNYLGHFLLTHLLVDLLKRGAPSRIVNISCYTHQWAHIDLEDLMMEKSSAATATTAAATAAVANPARTPHSNSKLCLILFSRELGKRLRATGIHSYALCPGLMKPATGIFELTNPGVKQILGQGSRMILGSSLEQGCETVLHCAVSRTCAQDSGRLYRFGQWWKEADTKLEDDQQGTKLWQETKRLIPTKYWRK